MATKLFVGSLAWTATEDEVREAFAEVGEVVSVAIPTDRETGRSRGFAFVEMANEEDAKKAVEQLNEKEIAGRNIIVNEARPREDR
ncbi:MAG: RNA-binding protein [bacterium]